VSVRDGHLRDSQPFKVSIKIQPSGSSISGLTDSSINSDVYDALLDGYFSHAELENLLTNAAVGGIKNRELNSLRLIADELNDYNYLPNSAKYYYSYIFDSLVNGNNANAFWTGGGSSRSSLGNLDSSTTKAEMKKLISKWFGGTDRPTNFFGGDTAAGIVGTSFEYQQSSANLFVDGVNYNDIHQGGAGTCYLLAAAASLLVNDSTAISNMFIDNGDGTYGVRFFGSNGDQIWVTVDDYLPSYGSSTNLRYGAGGDKNWDLHAGDLWVGLLEKAYAQANEIGVFGRSSSDGYNSYDQIEGGFNEAMSHISGNTVHTYASGNYNFQRGFDANTGTNISAYSDANWLDLGEHLTTVLDGGGALWIGCWDDHSDSSGKRTAVAGHAFSIIDYGYNAFGDLYFTLLNPWGAAASGSNPSYRHTFDFDWADINDWSTHWISSIE